MAPSLGTNTVVVTMVHCIDRFTVLIKSTLFCKYLPPFSKEGRSSRKVFSLIQSQTVWEMLKEKKLLLPQ